MYQLPVVEDVDSAAEDVARAQARTSWASCMVCTFFNPTGDGLRSLLS